MADAADLKSAGGNPVRVRVPPAALCIGIPDVVAKGPVSHVLELRLYWLINSAREKKEFEHIMLRQLTLAVLLVTGFLSLVGACLVPKLWAQTAALPDLTINQDRLRTSIVFRKQVFKSTDCAIVEGCVTGSGKRSLMKFDVEIRNVGTADLILGSPTDPSNSSLFQFSSCHGHYHLTGFASYELLNSAGTVVLTGRKQAFCLEDYTKIDPNAGPAKYTCSNQGIQVGWADVYGSYLDCQWLDVTGIPLGHTS